MGSFSFKRICIAVFSIHFFFLGFALLGPSFAPAKPKHKPLLVKTILPPPSVRSHDKAPASGATPAVVKPKKQPPAAAKPKPQATPSKKEPAIADKTISKKKQTPQKKASPPENRARISDSLVRELEESIAKIEGKKSSPPSQVKSQTAPIRLQIDAADSTSSSDSLHAEYVDTLVYFLHQSLHLPEFGEVKIQLTLRQDGTVAKLVVLKTESEKNKGYLQTHLPDLKLPRFDSSVTAEKECTFVLTFCNETSG